MPGKNVKAKKSIIGRTIALLVLASIAAGVWMYADRIIHYFQPLPLSPEEVIWGRLGADEPGPFTIGDRIPVTLEVDIRNPIQCELPDLSKVMRQGSLEVFHSFPPQKEIWQDGIRHKIKYLIVGWQAGKHTLPALTVNYKDAGGDIKTYQIPGQVVNIVSVLPQKKSKAELLALEIKGIKNPLGFPLQYRLLYWYLLTTVVVATFLFAFWLSTRKSREEPVQPEIPPEPAHVIALRRLAAVKAAGYLAKGQYVVYYTELSECIREYMEKRFQINALEMTTEEFLAHPTTRSYLTKEQQDILRNFMEASDLVKFAKYKPETREADWAMYDLEQLIMMTREAEDAEEGPPVESGRMAASA